MNSKLSRKTMVVQSESKWKLLTKQEIGEKSSGRECL